MVPTTAVHLVSSCVVVAAFICSKNAEFSVICAIPGVYFGHITLLCRVRVNHNALLYSLGLFILPMVVRVCGPDYP